MTQQDFATTSWNDSISSIVNLSNVEDSFWKDRYYSGRRLNVPSGNFYADLRDWSFNDMISSYTMFRIAGPAWVGVLLLVLMSGCGSSSSDVPSVAIPPITAHAVLDLSSSTIELPIAAYGMSLGDEQFVLAAQSIVLWRCANHTEALSSQALEDAQAWLSWGGYKGQWLYGYWDAPYVTANGLVPKNDQPGGSVSPADAPECFQQSDYLSLAVVDTSTAGSLATSRLVRDTVQALDSATRDPRFVALVAARVSCVEKQGYSTGDNELGSVVIDASWSSEQTLRAALAEATCSDELNFVQQAGDINATYEQLTIDANQAEFVAIKQIADDRVAQATEVLRSAGLI